MTRKQREIAERESRILAVARASLIEDGYHGVSMERIAQALEYSKGTIYNHFSCKEEVIIAVAIETMNRRTAMFERAAAFVGRSRERMLAVGCAAELFFRLFPDHFRVEQIIRSASIWEKTSEKRRNAMESCEHRCIGILAGIVRDGIANRDLVLPEHICPEELVFGLWSMTHGAFQLANSGDSLQHVGIRQPLEVLRVHQHRLLDGYGWLPLSTQHDYSVVMERLQADTFAEEFAQLSKPVA